MVTLETLIEEARAQTRAQCRGITTPLRQVLSGFFFCATAFFLSTTIPTDVL